MSPHFRISNLLAARLAEHGIALPRLLLLAGLPPGFLHQEKILATTAELFSLYRAIGEASPDPGIGLRLGSEPRLERSHPGAVAAVCSRTYRDALERMARYKKLTCPEDIKVRSDGEQAAVEFVYIEAVEIEPDVLVDMGLSWIFSIASRGTEGQIVPRRLELTRTTGNRGLLEEHFGCRVRFKAARNALVFHDKDLDRPFVTHNEELLAAVGAQLESDLLQRGASADAGEQVRRCLRLSLAGKRPTLQNIARELGMSPRTLQRRLGEASVTFQQLVEETRRDLSRHYLRNSTVELNEVAFLLGYEDATSFFRAFQEWENASPGEWRARHRAVAVGAA